MNIQEILGSDLCSGCGLCEGVFGSEKISVELSEDGFLRPKMRVALSPIENEYLNKICPGIRLEQLNSEANYHTHWGPFLESFAGRSVDDPVCHNGSSGGVISALAIFLLENGLVSGVIQTTVFESEPLNNVTVISRSREEILACAGSRYAPSAPLTDLSRILEQPGPFLFIGKPCDVAGLRALSRVDQRVNKKIAYMFAFFCAGIPSQNATHRVLGHFGLAASDVLSFRYRGDGWPGKTVVKTKDNREFSMKYAESWGTILNQDLQFRCKICVDGTGEFADIACADAWYGDEAGYPTFEEAEGRSLILARTQAGAKLLEKVVSKGVLSIESFPIDQIRSIQPYQFKRKSLIVSRLLALYFVGRKVPRYVGLHILRAACSVSIREQLRSFKGMLRRASLPNDKG